MKDKLQVQGFVELECRTLATHERWTANFLGLFSNNWKTLFAQSHGSLKWSHNTHNLITNAGFAGLSARAGGLGGVAAFTFLAVGTSNTAPLPTQTTLIAEITTLGLARAAATVSQATDIVANNTLRLTYTWTASGTVTVEGIGVFNASSAGTMLGRATTGSKALTSGDFLTATYNVKFS